MEALSLSSRGEFKCACDNMYRFVAIVAKETHHTAPDACFGWKLRTKKGAARPPQGSLSIGVSRKADKWGAKKDEI